MTHRQPGLDLLRALAIGWVMLYHVASYGVALPGIVHHGWMGVDLFFVLSGYLIGAQVLRPYAEGNRPSWRFFLLRRAFRVLPAYLAVLALYAMLPTVRESAGLRPLWQFLTFTVNLVPDAGRLAFSHAWSLCVEEHFYLLLPPVVWLLGRYPGTRRTAALALALLVGGMLLRGWLWQAEVEPYLGVAGENGFFVRYVSLIYNPTWARLDGLLAGVMLAAVQVFRGSWWERATRWSPLFLAAGLAGLALAMRIKLDSHFGAIVVFPLVAASFGCLVLAAATGRSRFGRLRVPGAAYLAAISFSLYLTHKATFHVVRAQFGDALAGAGPMALAVYLAASLAVATLLYLVVERPFLRLRDRLLLSDGVGRVRSGRAGSAHAVVP
ncbi:acyltransferase family protein [Massilia niabensis]|uniref:Acyltransferase family protein n=1 Tax=Massilia niabensis TaxID=544910 RepID=A0ABW0L445_9BURK